MGCWIATPKDDSADAITCNDGLKQCAREFTALATFTRVQVFMTAEELGMSMRPWSVGTTRLHVGL